MSISNVKRTIVNLWSAIIHRPIATFIAGALVGLAFFAIFYGLDIVNPTNTNWIWQGITHDTAQHQLGWEFYRADSTGGIINGLAYPVGLSAIFMDVIPLLAIIFKPFSAMLPSNFQYFGLWGLLCYLLMGGLSALLLRRIWLKVNSNNRPKLIWQYLFIVAGSLIFVLSPMVMARSFYHPALAGQWLILLGFLLILDSPKVKHWWNLIFIWSVVLVMTVLIHPYFLPMMGVLMVLSIVRYWPMLQGKLSLRWAKAVAIIAISGVMSLVAFGLMGGFSQGTGSEVHDLEEKGFNLLSFVNPGGYSVIPAFPNRSTSPETMMWLGLGVLAMLLLSAWMWQGNYRQSWRNLRRFIRQHRGQFIVAAVFCLLLLIFAIGVRVDLGPITLFQYSVPNKIYELWSAFRAAAREAWPFYYATILAIIYWFCCGIKKQLVSEQRQKLPMVIALVLCLCVALQSVDILCSPNAQAKYQGFRDIANRSAEFTSLDFDNIINGQQHLVALDEGFRGDQSGTYVIGRTALQYGLTLNIGFFARVPDEINNDIKTWRGRLINNDMTNDNLSDYLFFTTDDNLANRLADNYQITKIDKYYFIGVI